MPTTYFIVNQFIMLIAKKFFFPGPECLSRIGCDGLFQILDKMEQPLLSV
jgi:hypothetical protein